MVVTNLSDCEQRTPDGDADSRLDALLWTSAQSHSMKTVRKFLSATYLWVLLLPVTLTILGAGSNQLVLWANHDKFPVMINPAKMQVMTDGEATEKPDGSVDIRGGHFVILPDGTIMLDPIHCLMTKQTHLNFLADVFDFQSETASIGDLMLELGDWMYGFAPFLWGALLCLKVYRLTP